MRPKLYHNVSIVFCPHVANYTIFSLFPLPMLYILWLCNLKLPLLLRHTLASFHLDPSRLLHACDFASPSSTFTCHLAFVHPPLGLKSMRYATGRFGSQRWTWPNISAPGSDCAARRSCKGLVGLSGTRGAWQGQHQQSLMRQSNGFSMILPYYAIIYHVVDSGRSVSGFHNFSTCTGMQS